LEEGGSEKAEAVSGIGLALGVSELDLGLCLRTPVEEDLLRETANEVKAIGAE
jgi:hypothetical protein